MIEDEPNLDIMQGMVERLIIEDNKVKGVEMVIGSTYEADAVVLTTGTFLRGEIILGNLKYSSGPVLNLTISKPNSFKCSANLIDGIWWFGPLEYFKLPKIISPRKNVPVVNTTASAS